MYENIRPTNARTISTMSRISPILESAFRRRVFINSTLGIFAKVVDSSIGSLLHYLLVKLLLRKEKHLHVPVLISIQRASWGWLVDRRERINSVLPQGVRQHSFETNGEKLSASFLDLFTQRLSRSIALCCPPSLNPNRAGQTPEASQNAGDS